jgi:hypothetical protein
MEGRPGKIFAWKEKMMSGREKTKRGGREVGKIITFTVTAESAVGSEIRVEIARGEPDK